MWKWALVPILLVAVYTDWRWRRIYNWLTFPSMAVGLILSGLMGGYGGVEASVIGLAVACGVFLVLYLVARLGAGDLKLMMAIGAWLGYPQIVLAMLYVGVAGGVIAVAFAVRYGALKRVLQQLKFFLMAFFTPGLKPETVLGESVLPPFPYGVAIALGTIAALAWPRLLGG